MIASLESQVSELERLKNSLQIQINDLNVRISTLENSLADKDAIIASYASRIDVWEAHNLNLHESIVATNSNVNIPEGLCWNVNLYNTESSDPTLYAYMMNYNGYFVVDYSATQTIDVSLHDDQGWWTNSPEKSSDVLYIPHTPDTVVNSDQANEWVIQLCSLNAQTTLEFEILFRF